MAPLKRVKRTITLPGEAIAFIDRRVAALGFEHFSDYIASLVSYDCWAEQPHALTGDACKGPKGQRHDELLLWIEIHADAGKPNKTGSFFQNRVAEFILKKLSVILITFFLLTHPLQAADLITRKGAIYQNFTVTAVEKTGLRIAHKDGIAFVEFEEMQSSDQAKYGWTKEKSDALKAELIAKQKAAAAAALQLEQSRLETQRLAQEQAAREQQQRYNEEHREEIEATAAKHAEHEAQRKADQERAEQIERDARTLLKWTVIACVIGFFVYFIPSFIAIFTGRRNALAICALNFFLGWTLIGWVGSLVWSLCRDPERQS